MNKKQKMSLLSLGLCVSLSTSAFASGAPTSQFGFSGWPYRQQSGCVTQSTPSTCSPSATPCPKPTNSPWPETTATALPEISQAPTQRPSPAPTQQATESPVIVPTATPFVTPSPQATATQAPTVLPTAAPTAVPTATSTPQITEKPVETTLPPSTDDDYTTGSVSAQEENAFLLLNADRNNNGRSSLVLDPALCDLARLKSRDMNDNHYFAHTSPTLGSASEMLKNHGYAFASVGENIAHHATVEKAQAAFMSSTGHRNNILGTQWTKVGVGVWKDAQGFVYVTQLFVR